MKNLILKSLSLFSVVFFLVACSSSKKNMKEISADSSSAQSEASEKEVKLPTTQSHDYISSVKTKVRAESDKVADCYTEAIKESEDLVGKIYFAWSILETGAIENLRVNREKSTIKSENLETCMFDIFNQISFDPLVDKDVVHVNYPFKFTGKKRK